MIALLKALFLNYPRAPLLVVEPRCEPAQPAARDVVPVATARPTVGLERVYVCHPDAHDPRVTVRRVRRICRRLIANGQVPIAPHLYLPAFLDPHTEHALALALRFELVGVCHELHVYGGMVTSEMRREIDHAAALGLRVRFLGLAA